MILRPYQTAALAAVNAAAARGINRPLVVLPTGTGKTIVFSELIRQRKGHAIVLAHREELLEQAAAKMRMVEPTADVGIVKAERNEHAAAIVVASVQTLARPERLAALAPTFTTVVVDEGHHAVADSYARILEHLGSFRDDGPLTLGVTATPERGDGTSLCSVWQEIVYQAELLPMIEASYLSDLRAIQVRLEANLDAVHTRGGDLVASELDAALRLANAPEHVLAAYQQHAVGRKTLIFTPTVASAFEMTRVFEGAGIASEAIDGDTDAVSRRAILDRFRSGETRVVSNCAVLTEGFDEPSIDCVIIARPTQSRTLFQQMIGRGTRVFPGKRDCLVLDLVGSTSRHELVTVATLFDLSPVELETATVTEAVGARRRVVAQAEAHGQLVAQAVDLFRRRAFQWVASDPTKYVLTLGSEGLLLLTSLDLRSWSVEHVVRGERQVLVTNLDLGFAQGTAEDFARRLGAGRVADRNAPWRRAPATDNQYRALRRWGIPIAGALTKGEASDMIAAAAGRCA